jgi:hemin uptake protein HemP
MVESVSTASSADEPSVVVGSRRAAPGPREITSAELLRGAREILIRHGEESYRLRLTRNGKLILHK